MTYLLGLAVVALVAAVVMMVVRHHQYKPIKARNKAQASIESEFAWPARQIIKGYQALPESHQPSHDILAILRALAVKYDRAAVNSHYSDLSRYTYDRRFSWNCSCVWDEHNYQRLGSDCHVYPEYLKLMQGVESVQSALAAQEQAMKDHEHKMRLAGVESDLLSIESLTEALRSERELIETVTEEII